MAKVITLRPESKVSGFTGGQFRKLDGLFIRAASDKILASRSVDCDFDDGVARYTYYRIEGHPPYLQFKIKRVGPGASMYEVYMQGKGRIIKTGLFERAFERLEKEIKALSE
ncbi:MAG: hypothetical protein KTR28_03935 [Micavibrio sp.]|nr:hypothetical protein [Micavibrio sp.]